MAARPPLKSGRAFSFVLNNPVDVPFVWNEATMNYLVYQKEKGESGTPHWQGYVSFKGVRRPAALKKINSAIHWENAIGSAAQNKVYCTKPEGRIEAAKEFGVCPQGEHPDAGRPAAHARPRMRMRTPPPPALPVAGWPFSPCTCLECGNAYCFYHHY